MLTLREGNIGNCHLEKYEYRLRQNQVFDGLQFPMLPSCGLKCMMLYWMFIEYIIFKATEVKWILALAISITCI